MRLFSASLLPCTVLRLTCVCVTRCAASVCGCAHGLSCPILHTLPWPGPQDLFSTAGAITDVKLVKDKATGQSAGSAFVKFDDHHAAATALQTINGHCVYGKVRAGPAEGLASVRWGPALRTRARIHPRSCCLPGVYLTVPEHAQQTCIGRAVV